MASTAWQAILYVVGFLTLGMMMAMLLSTFMANRSAVDKIAELRTAATARRVTREEVTKQQIDLMGQWYMGGQKVD